MKKKVRHSKYFNIFNDISTRNKLLMTYMLVVFLPVMLVGVFLTVRMREMAMDRAISEASMNVDRVKKRVSDTLSIPISLSNKLYIDSRLADLTSMKYHTTWDVVQAYWNYNDIQDFSNVYRVEIKNIRFYVDNNTLLDSWNFYKTSDDVKKQSWYVDTIKNNSGITWRYTYNDLDIANTGYFLSMTRLLNGVGQLPGVLVIDMGKANLANILKQESFDTILLDEKGNIISAKEDNLVGKTEEELNIDIKKLTNEKEINDIVYKGKPSKLIIGKLKVEGDGGNFKVLSVFPVDSILTSANKTSVMGFSIIALSLFLACILIIIFSRAISKRLSMLSLAVHRVASGDFNSISKIDGKDEIGQLARDIDKMSMSLKELIEEVYEANIQKNLLTIKQKEIKLQILANQINPHFLFNSLETIRMKAHCKGEEEISEIVQRLGALLRRNLEVGSEAVLLTTELELVRDYLEIQRFRFGDKIQYNINIYDDISHYKVLPLILQPIVENAIIHGLENMEDAGVITIELRKVGNKLEIYIVDNGLGMSEKKLTEVINSLDDSNDALKTIGIRNVHQRVKLFYGDQFGLSIISKLNEGTRIHILLPWN